MATANVKCPACEKEASFEHPDEHDGPRNIKWECSNCGATGTYEQPGAEAEPDAEGVVAVGSGEQATGTTQAA